MTNQVAMETLSPEYAFAMHIESACENFEILQRLISGKFTIEPKPAPGMVAPADLAEHLLAVRAPSLIRMALAKSFVFDVRRANRICKNNTAAMKMDRETRKQFIKDTDPVTAIRDVNEHGFDGKKQDAKPSLHEHPVGHLDETSIFINGADKILMGPLNLADLYPKIALVRTAAGFVALARMGGVDFADRMRQAQAGLAAGHEADKPAGDEAGGFSVSG